AGRTRASAGSRRTRRRRRTASDEVRAPDSLVCAYDLLGEAAEVADRISARIAALDGGVDTIVLNPLNWSSEQLELIAGEVLPRVKTIDGDGPSSTNGGR